MTKARRLSVSGCVYLSLSAGLVLLCGVPDSRAQQPAEQSRVWFHDIRGPITLDEEQLTTTCRELLQGVKTGVFPESVLLLGGDTGARGAFLSVSDGTSRARVSFGAGEGLGKALREAFETLPVKANERGAMRWLKLDIVQYATTVNGFVARESPVPEPSLVGLAFGPASGFAFLPEQLVGWEMVDSKHRLTIHHINRHFVNEGDWDAAGRWLRISTFQGGQKVCLFETQSVFWDGARLLPLYRGHRLYEQVTVDEMLDVATVSAKHVVGWCDGEGAVASPLREWVTVAAGGNEPLQYAQAMIALTRLSTATGDKAFLDTAQRMAAKVVTGLRRYGPGGKQACLVQADYRTADPDPVVDPVPIVVLDTNALLTCALADLNDAVEGSPYTSTLTYLARHLLAQLRPGGDVVVERRFPSGRIIPRVDVPSNGLAVKALVRLYEVFKRSEFLDRAEPVVDYLLTTHLESRSMEGLPRDPWLMEALDAYFTYKRDERILVEAQRIALATVTDQVRDPYFPDLFGSVPQLPSATESAGRTHLLAVAARLLRDTGRTQAADELLGDAVPGVLFQIQARMLPPSAMYLGTPVAYEGLFRDHLRHVGFDLRGQAVQILSLLALRRELAHDGASDLPISETIQTQLTAARAKASTFPKILNPDFSLPPAPRGNVSPMVSPVRREVRPLPSKQPKDGPRKRRRAPLIRPVPKP